MFIASTHLLGTRIRSVGFEAPNYQVTTPFINCTYAQIYHFSRITHDTLLAAGIHVSGHIINIL